MTFPTDFITIWNFLYNSGFILWLCFFGIGILIGYAVMFALIKSNSARF